MPLPVEVFAAAVLVEVVALLLVLAGALLLTDVVALLDAVALLVVVALLIFGGETLHGFSAALVIGILAGTYSSIYISAAIALDFGLRSDDLLERKHTKPEEVDGLP